jgi:hypothetical protein
MNEVLGGLIQPPGCRGNTVHPHTRIVKGRWENAFKGCLHSDFIFSKRNQKTRSQFVFHF